MEAKKYPQADVYKLSGLFFNIGLVVSLGLVYGIFHINFKYENAALDINTNSYENLEVVDIPPTQQPPPPPPKLEVHNLVEVANESEVIEDLPVIDLEMREDATIEAIEYQEEVVLEAPEEEKADEIFTVVEEQAQPVGGVAAFYQYVADQLEGNYPAAAERMHVEGVVYVQFVVEKDGSITDVQIMKGIGAGCDELAEKVVANSPAWIPGKQRGKPVRSYKMVAIRFILKVR